MPDGFVRTSTCTALHNSTVQRLEDFKEDIKSANAKSANNTIIWISVITLIVNIVFFVVQLYIPHEYNGVVPSAQAQEIRGHK